MADHENIKSDHIVVADTVFGLYKNNNNNLVGALLC